MKKFIVLALVVLSLSACTTLGQPPVSGFGSNLPNGLVLKRVVGYDFEVVAETGLGNLDIGVAWAANTYRQTDMEENFDYPSESSNVTGQFGIARLACVSTDARGYAKAHWLEVPSTYRLFRGKDACSVLTVGSSGGAPAVAEGIAATLGKESETLDGSVEKIRLIMVVDDCDRVIIQERGLDYQYVICAAVRTAEEANRFLTANLLPPPQE